MTTTKDVAEVFEDVPSVEHLDSIVRLTKDLREAAETMGVAEIRFIVDGYYEIQKYRTSVANQIRQAKEQGEPALILGYLFKQAKVLESQMKNALDRWTLKRPVGRWMRSHTGVGPVITAGMLAHIDITKAPTAGHIYSFAGLNPEQEWKKGEKRPWNARLKVLCWKLGECFKKFHNHENCTFGHLYAARKEVEVARSEAGGFADVAKKTLEEKKFRKSDTRDAYEAGKLPNGRLDLRAMRFPVKLFLSHLHTVMYFEEFGKTPPVPFAFTKNGGNHSHYVFPMNLKETGYKGLHRLLEKQYGKERSA